jgi:hypothetical protein
VSYWPVYPPVGYYYEELPADYATIEVDGTTYYEADGTYYTEGEQDGQDGYVVAEAPAEEDLPTPEVLAGDPDAPDPFEVLKEMCDYVTNQQQFTVGLDYTAEDVMESGQKITKTGTRTVYVRRPDRVAALLKGDHDDRHVVFDGKAVTMVDKVNNAFATIDVSGTIEDMIDTLANDYGFCPPLADLIYSDSYGGLVGQTKTGQYVGLHNVGKFSCHHLAFTQETVDWEIWIQSENRPVPRKLVIVYKSHPGSPRHTVTITRWEPSVAGVAFDLTAPTGAERIDIVPLQQPSDQPPKEAESTPEPNTDQ